MNKNILIGVAVIIILLSGGMYVMSQQSSPSMDQGKETAMEKKDVVAMEKQDETTDTMMEEKGSMAKDTMAKDAMMSSYTGTILAGKASPYIEFNTKDYEMAKKEGKILFLEFYANWCPICRAQAPKLVEGFNSLERTDVVGFRVNYNDPETDDTEKALAKEFGVTYQHTHVIVKDGKVLSKSNDDLDKESFVALLDSVK